MRQGQDGESSGETAAARWQVLRPALEGFVHEARNPLHALVLQLEVLGVAPGVPGRRTAEMRAQLERLRQLVDAVEAAAVPGRSGARTLDERVERALELLRWTFHRRQVTCRARVTKVPVASDDAETLEFLVGQVLWHALSRCPDGGALEIVVHAERGSALLEVMGGGDAGGDWVDAPFRGAAARLGGSAFVRGGSARLELPAGRGA